MFIWCFLSVWRVSWEWPEGVCRLSWICLDECLVSDWKVFGGCMKRVSCKIYISNHFFVCKYLIRMVRTGWAKTGLVSSCLDMSGQNILFQKVLDLNIFGIQNILGNKKILWSKIFWTQNYFEIKIFLDPIFVFLFLAPKSSSKWISSVALPAQLVFITCSGLLTTLSHFFKTCSRTYNFFHDLSMTLS